MSKKSYENPGYELSDTKFKPLLVSGITLFGVVIVAIFLMLGLFNFFGSRSADRPVTRSPLAFGRQLPPLPRLQVDPEADWSVFEARQDSVLHSYGWVGRDAGVVRVPIEKVMEIAIARGFPSRAPQADELDNR